MPGLDVYLAVARHRLRGEHLEIWGDMGRYGELWGAMGNYGELWGDMGRYGEIWGDMGRYGERHCLGGEHLVRVRARLGLGGKHLGHQR